MRKKHQAILIQNVGTGKHRREFTVKDTITLRQLQEVHETILGQPLNKDSFRRRMLASGQLEATGDKQRDVGHRPAELYRFSKRSAV